MKRLVLASLLVATAASAAPGGTPAFDVGRIARDIQTLSSDAFEGRGPATAGETKSIAYIAAQMKAAGLQPAGDGGSWFQDVPLLKSEIVGAPRSRSRPAGRRCRSPRATRSRCAPR